MSVPLQEGENAVNLQYTPLFVGAGIFITAVSVILFVSWYIIEKKKQKRFIQEEKKTEA